MLIEKRMKLIEKKIDYAQKMQGLLNKDVAKRLGISERAFTQFRYRMRNGHTVTVETIINIAKALNVDVCIFFS